jgi:hypothetical protein
MTTQFQKLESDFNAVITSISAAVAEMDEVMLAHILCARQWSFFHSTPLLFMTRHQHTVQPCMTAQHSPLNAPTPICSAVSLLAHTSCGMLSYLFGKCIELGAPGTNFFSYMGCTLMCSTQPKHLAAV